VALSLLIGLNERAVRNVPTNASVPISGQAVTKGRKEMIVYFDPNRKRRQKQSAAIRRILMKRRVRRLIDEYGTLVSGSAAYVGDARGIRHQGERVVPIKRWIEIAKIPSPPKDTERGGNQKGEKT
jgi:hypothetical protein